MPGASTRVRFYAEVRGWNQNFAAQPRCTNVQHVALELWTISYDVATSQTGQSADPTPCFDDIDQKHKSSSHAHLVSEAWHPNPDLLRRTICYGSTTVPVTRLPSYPVRTHRQEELTSFGHVVNLFVISNRFRCGCHGLHVDTGRWVDTKGCVRSAIHLRTWGTSTISCSIPPLQ